MNARQLGPVEAGVLTDLQGLPEELQRSALAASALHLARVQDTTTSARDVASVARELRGTLAQLLADVTTEQEGDGVDDLLDRRRRRGGSGPADPVDPAVGQ